MAARSVGRAVERAYQNPFCFLSSSKLQQHRPAFGDDAGKNLGVCSQFQFSAFLDETSQHRGIPRSGLGFPPHSDGGQSRGSLFLVDKLPSHPVLSSLSDVQLHTKMQRLGLSPSLLLREKKMEFQDATSESLWKLTNSSYSPPSTEMDEVILPGQDEDANSPMLMNTKRTFNPSTIVRKRRHGFLARKATVGGRRVLARRFAKGRRRLSA